MYVATLENRLITDTDATLAFQALDPTRLLDAIDAAGWTTDGRVSALNSYENRVYAIGIDPDSERPASTGGDAGRDAALNPSSLIAKFYRPERWSDAAINEEHAFCRTLVEHDLPVVAPLSASDGRTLFKTGPYRFCLFDRVGGRPPELDDSLQLQVIGRTLGRLHAVGAVHRFEHRPRIDAARFGDRSVAFLLESALLPDALRAAYAAVTALLLREVHAQMKMLTTLSTLCLHGDFHPGNLLWSPQGTPWLLDFDDTATGPAVADLWMFLSGDRHYAQARLGDLLDGYLQFHEFDERELALIEPLRTLRIIHYAAWIARRWEDPAFRLAFPFFDTARFWDDHILSLKEQQAALDEPPLRY